MASEAIINGIEMQLPLFNYCKAFPTHRNKILEQLNEQRVSGTHCDITLHVDQVDFHAHRCILAASCKKFSQLIAEDPQSDYIRLNADIKADAFMVILQYLYTGTVTIEPDSVGNVLHAAIYFSLQDIEKSCKTYEHKINHSIGEMKKRRKWDKPEFEVKSSSTTVQTKTIRVQPVKDKVNMFNTDSCSRNTNTDTTDTIYLNGIEALGEPEVKVELEGTLPPFLAELCEQQNIISNSYDERFESIEASELIGQIMFNENRYEHDPLKSEIGNVCSNIDVKLESIDPSFENIVEPSVETLVKKKIVKRRKLNVRKQAKISSTPSNDNDDTVMFDGNTTSVGLESHSENLCSVLSVNLFPIASVDKFENVVDSAPDIHNSLLDGNAVPKRRRCRKETNGHDSSRKKRIRTRPAKLSNAGALFPCSFCSMKFNRKCDLTRHLHKHVSVTFTCRYCSCQFQTTDLFKKHSITVHGDKRCFSCSHDGCKYRSSRLGELEVHRLIHSQTPHFQCVACGKSFAQPNGLRSHLKSCLKQKSYLCDFCGTKFNYESEMITHRRIHTGEKPFQCHDCTARFSDFQNYKRHRRIHENKFPYSCVICKKQFRHSNSLKAHMNNH